MKDPRINERPRMPEFDRGVTATRERPTPAASFQSVVTQAQVAQQSAQQEQHGRDPSERRESNDRRRDPHERPRERRPVHERAATARGTAQRGDARQQSAGHARVVSKHDGEREQRGGQHGQQQQGRGGQQHRGPGERVRDAALEKASAAKHDANVATVAVFAKQLQRAKEAAVPQAFDPAQMQHMVNQMIAAFRVGKTTLGADTLIIGFSAHVFAGLQLQITAKDGKVVVQWRSGNPAVRALFERERSTICAALAKKDIAVAEYVVEREKP